VWSLAFDGLGSSDQMPLARLTSQPAARKFSTYIQLREREDIGADASDGIILLAR
jgi:hypothetical protein